MPKRRRHSGEFKFKVALEAAKGTKTLGELAREYQLHPSQISEWKQQLLAWQLSNTLMVAFAWKPWHSH